MITREKLENYLYNAVELEEKDTHRIREGWLVKDRYYKNAYALLPFNDAFHIYVYKVSHIKKIKFLTNGYEIK